MHTCCTIHVSFYSLNASERYSVLSLKIDHENINVVSFCGHSLDATIIDYCNFLKSIFLFKVLCGLVKGL